MIEWDSQPETEQLEALYRDHAQAVYRLAFRGLRGDVRTAEDVVQQVFLAVCQQYGTHFRGQSTDRQARLITTIAKRRVTDCYRRALRSPEILCGELADLDRPTDELAEFPLPTQRSDRITEDAQLKQLWDALTQDLTTTEYQVAFMTWELEMPTSAISQTLATTAAAVSTHRSRARRKMREALGTAYEGGAGA